MAPHIILQGSVFTNAYTSGGSVVSSLPSYDTQAPGYGTPRGRRLGATDRGDRPRRSHPSVTASHQTIRASNLWCMRFRTPRRATVSGTSQTQQQAYISNAINLVADALDGSTTNAAVTGFSGSGGLIANVTTTQGLITNANAVHTQTLATLETQTSNITSINSATIADELSSLQTQLEATYKVTASTLNLSILTYLGT